MSPRKKKSEVEIKQEALGILIMAFALLIFLSLVSFHPNEFPNSGDTQKVSNWLGPAGAHISHYLYNYTIGYSSLILPFLIFLMGWTVFLQRAIKPFLRLSLYLIALGVFLSTVLAMPKAISPDIEYSNHLSGALGLFFAKQLNQYLSAAGSFIVLLTFLIIFFISATSWSMRESLLGFKEEVRSLFNAVGRQTRKLKFKRLRETAKPGTSRNIPITRPEEDVKIRKTAIQEEEKKFQPQPQTHAPQVKKSPQERIREREPVKQPVPSATGTYMLPHLDLLKPTPPKESMIDRQALEKKAHFLEEKLREFDVRGNVVGIQPGPIITRFEIKPAPGVKVSRFVGCQDDLALVMQAQRVRIVAPIPGKAAVGIEVPNETPAMVSLREVLESKSFQRSTSKLTIALGLTIDGKPYITDLCEMPHLLVAGATGSGKSVCLNTIIASILFRARPTEVKFVLIDPKKLELALYRKLRNHHLTTREDLSECVITSVNNAVSVLRSLEVVMERRYNTLAKANVRNIEDYNRALKAGRIQGTDQGKPADNMPYIILVVDELADLMVTGAREFEEPIARLAQMSRAVGIHLILATQRPSVDVITGVIKANFPSRIAFQTAQKSDSRTIIDRNGAEKLLGRGDMLFLHPREPNLIRIHGAFISTGEVQRITEYISKQPGADKWRLPSFGAKESTRTGRGRGDRDELFREAAKLVIRHQQGSASLLQRRLRVGYARAGRLIDELEEIGILGPYDGSKAREVLVDESALERLDELIASNEENQEEGNGQEDNKQE